MATSPKTLLDRLRAANTEVDKLQTELAAKQVERDAEIARIHAKWNPVLTDVETRLNAARQAVKIAREAIDNATAPSETYHG